MPAMIDLKLDGDGAWPDLAAKLQDGTAHWLGASTPLKLCCLPGGTVEGNPSVAVRIDGANGQTLVCETTVKLFLAVADVIRARYAAGGEVKPRGQDA